MQVVAHPLAESIPMSQSSNSPLSLLTAPVTHTVALVRAAVLGVSVLAAIPTAHNLYYSWTHGIPFAKVPHRLAQYDLWMKNLDCKVNYRQLLTAAGTKVDVGACEKSGDIAIKVSGSGGQATYEWIAFNELQKPTTAGLFGLHIPSALAADAVPQSKPAGSLQVAQAGMEVKCQAPQGSTHLIRVVQDGGKCYRELLSILKGSVDKREEVPCTTQCK
jgi:hypothetical protein